MVAAMYWPELAEKNFAADNSLIGELMIVATHLNYKYQILSPVVIDAMST